MLAAVRRGGGGVLSLTNAALDVQSIPDYCTGSMLFGEKIATSATQGLSAITDEDDLEPDSVVTDCSSRKTAAGNKFKMGLNVFQKIGRQSHEVNA